MRLRWQYIALAALFCWSITAQLSYTILNIEIFLQRTHNMELPFHHVYSSTIIQQIPREYRGLGLERGDDVLALDGRSLTGRDMMENYPARLHPGQMLNLKVRRMVDGQPAVVNVSIRMHPLREESLNWAYLALTLLLPIGCLLIGFYIALARPMDPVAWITMAMLASFGQIPGSGDSWALPSPWRESLFIYHPLLSNTWPLWLLLFGLYFPTPVEFVRKRPWIVWIASVLPIVLIVFDVYGNFVLGRHMRETQWLTGVYASLRTPATLLFSAYVCTFFYLLAYKRHTISNPDAQRRIQLMIRGCSIALMPLWPIVFSNIGWLPHIPDWVQTALLLPLVMFPITMAYIIVVQRAMDVRMVVRSGVKYFIASNSIRVLRAVLLVALVIATTSLGRQSGHTAQALMIGFVGVASVLGIQRTAVRVNLWMDRRFFREAYHAEVILTELSNSLATIREIPLLVQTIARRISDSLHVDRIAVLLTSGEVLQPVYSIGFGETPPQLFQPSRILLQTVIGIGPTAKVYFDDPQSWVHATPMQDQAALQQLECQVLLPVTRKNRLLGIISLGPKRSEAPYSREDLQLLGALASQTGLVLENAELTENIRREVAARERLNRELEIAREVQQRLFPQVLPVVEGLDFFGYCRPALEVGGDYYDFIRLAGNGLGIAIGDVSGKGIAAALMMASLQACLRGQTLNAPATLAQMISNINSLVYEASAVNRYATFFYAQYHPQTRRLHYVNAGHNSPVLYRYLPDDDRFIRLEAGGTVIGLFPSVPFLEGEVMLESGDILVAFTDGISEAMNAQDDEYGEERLLDTLRGCGDCSARDAVSRLMQSVDEFTAGAPQHDDMTLLVVHVK